ncbi:MAG: hypothetical protein MRJ93_12985 [Nitrososphaeraceae archaeon]|nr:hypothetical protein [Nitrososphaeraceae archaeon]
MTFKDLSKIISLVSNNEKNRMIHRQDHFSASVHIQQSLERLSHIPFWVWADSIKHRDLYVQTQANCCFNHIIGLPQKNDKEYPLFDSEKLVIDAIENNQHIWIKKARGIGITELILRYLAWKCMSSNELDGKSIFLVSGTREEFSNNIKIRLAKLFERNFPNMRFESKYTELWLNNTWIKVFPTKRIQDLRGYTDVSYLFIDEADYFEPAEQNELEYVIKSYEEKSKCKIILASTPNRPDYLFARIEKNEIFKDFFHKLFLDYTHGLGKIFDTDFIQRERERNETYFEREYNLKYLGKIGNVFPLVDIDKATQLGIQYKDLATNPFALHIGGVDFGFSSSVTALYIAELDPQLQIVRIITGKEYDKKTPSEIANDMFSLHTQIPNLSWFVDGANRGAVNECKSKYGESLNWEKVEDINIEDDCIIPVNFGKEHKQMLQHLYQLLTKQKLAIDPKYDKLILSLKTAYAEEFNLDKTSTVHNDHLDSLRLLCKGVLFEL